MESKINKVISDQIVSFREDDVTCIYINDAKDSDYSFMLYFPDKLPEVNI